MKWIAVVGLGLTGVLAAKYWYVPFLRNPNRINLRKLGFRLETESHKKRVMDILTAFFRGFNAMLAEKEMASVREACDGFSSLLRPFAHEGAAMAFGLKTLLSRLGSVRSFERRMQTLSRELYLMYYIGLGFCAGMVFKSWPSRVKRTVDQLDSFYKYLCYDGFGFKIGLFDYLSNPDSLRTFSRFDGYSKHVCFQGFGRSLWFLFMDAASLIGDTISRQDPSVRGDCYAGVGLAVTFTNIDDLQVAFAFSSEVEPQHLADYFLGVTIALYTRREIDAAYLAECIKPLDAWQRSFISSGLQSCDRHFVAVAEKSSANHYELWRQNIVEDLKSMVAPQALETAS